MSSSAVSLKRRYVLAFFQKLPPCPVGIEACASSHHWSRELQALGHTVRLMPPAYVKPYVKRHKDDATDAEAIRRSGHQGEAAVRRDQDAGATELPDAAPYPSLVHPPADFGDQCHPRPSCRVRHAGALSSEPSIDAALRKYETVRVPFGCRMRADQAYAYDN